MSECRLLIFEDPLQLASDIESALSPEVPITLTQSDTTLRQLYQQDPSRFTKIILIHDTLSQAVLRQVTALQKISPFTEIVILTQESNFKQIFEFIKIGVTLHAPTISPKQLCQPDSHSTPKKIQDRINHFLCLAIQEKINSDTHSQETLTLSQPKQYLKEKRSKARLLMIEPDHSYEHLLKNSLLKHYAITSVETGKEALSALKKNHYELILLSDYLPDLPIIPTLEDIQETTPHSRIILLTAIGATEALKKWQHQGIHNAFFKPLPSPTHIIHTLEKELEKKYLCELFYSDESHLILNLFSKAEKIRLLEEIYTLKKSIQTPLYFEDILMFFPEANIHSTYAKHAVPDNKLRAGISAFIKTDF